MDKILKLISSLRLTVVLLALALILVFFGTMAQDPLGLYIVQKNYFQSMFVDWFSLMAGVQKTMHMLRIHVEPYTAEQVATAPWIPAFPGGYLIGWLLFVNLIAAHFSRFKFSWNKLGIFMTHFGLIFLLLGQFLTERLQVESHLRLEEGQSKNYSETDRLTELVFTDHSNPESDRVVSIPISLLKNDAKLSHPDLPVTINVKQFELNSRLAQHAPAVSTNKPAASQGIGRQAELRAVERATKMNEINVPSAVIFFSGNGAPEGTWLMSLNLQEPQSIKLGDKTWDAELRFKRLYVPYSIGLIDFKHDVYVGTERPKNFSSRIKLSDPSKGENRETTIKMNQPLRYAGTTYYQASFEKGRDDVTVLQVVSNPAWLTPYIAVIIVGLGLIVQFSIHLFKFTNRRKA